MEQTKRYHSVRLDKGQCIGCTNCLKHCPTEAIRVRGGRAHIIDERCIDCGECIRICDYHAKVAVTDDLSAIHGFPHPIALPDPALYGQFKDLKKVGHVLDALKKIGFEEVYEAARGADLVSRAIAEKLKEPHLPRPLISSACPAVVRLIQVCFPDLLPHIIDIRPPMEAAAMMARREFCLAHHCPPEDVGIFFITPCPAKMTAIRSPLGLEKSAVDGAISILDIYGLLLPLVSAAEGEPETPFSATPYGMSWATNNGESNTVCPGNSLAVDGIHNVMRVLEEIENDQLSDLDFFEGSACVGGCVGGPLTFQNNYVAKTALRKLVKQQDPVSPLQSIPLSMLDEYPLKLDFPLKPNCVMKLDANMLIAMQKMKHMNEIIRRLPGYDCGSCGSPTCRTLAEDIVRGYANETDCIHLLKDQLKVMAQQMVELAQTKRE